MAALKTALITGATDGVGRVVVLERRLDRERLHARVRRKDAIDGARRQPAANGTLPTPITGYIATPVSCSTASSRCNATSASKTAER